MTILKYFVFLLSNVEDVFIHSFILLQMIIILKSRTSVYILILANIKGDEQNNINTNKTTNNSNTQ